jgi:hypothetical protein
LVLLLSCSWLLLLLPLLACGWLLLLLLLLLLLPIWLWICTWCQSLQAWVLGCLRVLWGCLLFLLGSRRVLDRYLMV